MICVSGVNSATINWVLHDCFNDYELLVVPVDECANPNECMTLFKSNIHFGKSEMSKSISFLSENLESCTHYRAIVGISGIKNSYKIKNINCIL